MGVLARIGAVRAGRMTLGACAALAVAVAAIGLGCILLVPVSLPDAAFSARVAAWRALPPPPRPGKNR